MTSDIPSFIRDKKNHSKLYSIKREASNIDKNFGNEIDLSENISGQLKKGYVREKT